MTDLVEQLDAINESERLHAFVPTGSALSKALAVAEVVTAEGWSVTWKRTAKTRTIEVQPLKRTGND